MDETNAEALVREVQAAWNTHDMKRFAACFAQDADFVNVRGVWMRGRDEIEERHSASHAERFKNSREEDGRLEIVSTHNTDILPS